MSRKLFFIYVFVILFSNLFSITISLINNEIIIGDLLFIKNKDYYVEVGDKLYIINNKIIHEVSNSSQAEFDIMLYGTKDKSFDREQYAAIIKKNKRSLKQNGKVPYVKECNFVIKVGFETLGMLTNSSPMQRGETGFYMKEEVKSGFSFSGEYHYSLVDNIVLGAGFRFQSLKEFKDNDIPEDKFGFIPVYGLLSATVFKKDNINIGIIGNLGYNFFFFKSYFSENNKLSGGLYYGSGLTFQMDQKFMLDILYKINMRQFVISNVQAETLDTTYNSLLISIGYVLFQ